MTFLVTPRGRCKYPVDYGRIYTQLINRALNRKLTGYRELHHIVPTSMGGMDDTYNLVALTAREHFIAHLLLYKMGYETQIFSVQAFLQTANTHRKQEPKIKYKKWIRKAIAHTNAKLLRQRNQSNR